MIIPEETLALARRWLTNSPGPTPTLPTDEEVEGLAILIEQTREAEREKWLVAVDQQRERVQRLEGYVLVLRDVLDDLEWTANIGQNGYGCGICQADAFHRRGGEHAPTCKLAAVLSTTKIRPDDNG